MTKNLVFQTGPNAGRGGRLLVARLAPIFTWLRSMMARKWNTMGLPHSADQLFTARHMSHNV